MTRPLAQITADLDKALRSETSSAVQVGVLLLEAKKQIGHGGWIRWLDSNFGLSTKTAENYMTVAKFALKFETVANLKNLKLSLTTVYKMAWHKSLFTDEAVKAVFKRAKTHWVNDDAAIKIAMDLIPRSERAAAAAAKTAQEATYSAEAEAILDGPSPDLPEAPPPEPENFDLQEFERAIKLLLPLQTKPLKNFVATKFTPEQLGNVAKFMEQIAARKTKKAA